MSRKLLFTAFAAALVISAPALAANTVARRSQSYSERVERQRQSELLTRNLITKLLSQFRTSDRYIDEITLRKEVLARVSSKTLTKIAQTSLSSIRRALLAQAKELDIDRGTAENVFKIWQLVRRMKGLKSTEPARGEVIAGLTQAELDHWVEAFQVHRSATARAPHEFYYRAAQEAAANEFDFSANDLYAIKIAAVYYALGLDRSLTTTAEISARGREDVPYFLTFGQGSAVQNLPHARFGEALIQYLKSHPAMKNVPDGFWNYLRNWRFSGSINMIPDGTIVGQNTPIMRITSNPIDIVLVEAPLLSYIEDRTRAATYAARIVSNGNAQSYFEGGARRGLGSSLRAQAAYIAGFAGTSTIDAAMTFGIPAVGSAENHSFIGHFANELEAHTAALSIFDKDQSFLLTDTYDHVRGALTALRAGGADLKGYRIDSTIAGMSIDETLNTVMKHLEEAGFRNQRSGDTSKRPILYSDDLNETKMAELTEQMTDFVSALVGGRLKNGSSLGFVMKTVDVLDQTSGKHRPVTKCSNAEKAVWPGAKEVWREVALNGQALSDYIALDGEPIRSTADRELVRLDNPVMTGGQLLTQPESLNHIRERVARERRSLPTAIFSVRTTAKNASEVFPTFRSQASRQLREQALHLYRRPTKPQIGVYPISAEPLHEAHVEVVKQMMARYQLDRVYVIIAGDNPIHGKKYRMKAAARLQRARRMFANIKGVIVDDTETLSQEPTPTYLTMRRIEKAEGDADMYLMGGQDFIAYLPTFRFRSELMDSFHLIFADRTETANGQPIPKLTDLPKEILDTYRPLGNDGQHFVNANGRVLEVGQYPAINDVSSTAIRKQYDALPYSYLVHVTDAQWTFLDRSKRPTADQKADGALAVGGTEKTIDQIVAVVRAAMNSNRAKISYSKDAHEQVELDDATQNGEFHGEYAFPPHGMKGRPGPDGDSLIDELLPYFTSSNTVVIPDQTTVATPAGPRLSLVPFDLKSIGERIYSPQTVLGFEKNGVQSYSVFRNPRFQEYLKTVDPHRLLPHFHVGWCTDFCDRAVVLRERELGYESIVIIDGVAGVFPAKTAATIHEMLDAGVEFMTTAEFETLASRWQTNQSNWADVLNDMAEWRKNSETKYKILETLKDDYWKNELPVPNRCSIILDRTRSTP